MASYSFLAPRPTNAILSDVDHIREIQWILAQLNPSLADDAPEDSKRLVPLDSAKTQYRFERLVGSTWNSVGKLMHDVDTLDGFHASISAVKNTIPVYNADAKLVGDLTGNANTATTLKNIRKLQIGGIASGGSVNFDGSADATIEITQLTVNNANDTAINGILTIKHGGTGGADAATARANLGVPAIDHSSADKSFGVSSTTKYGHAIGSDTPNSTFTADNGYFFSPKGADDLDSTLRALIAQEVATRLSLSGGIMTGDLNFGHAGEIGYSNNSDYRALWINRDIGNAIGVFATDSPSNSGSILLRASDGSNYNDLWVFPNGTAALNGNKILTSAGGTVSGPFVFADGGSVQRTGQPYKGSLLAGSGDTRIWVFDEDSQNLPGHVLIRGTSTDFVVRNDGTCTVNYIPLLTSAGGTMTGPLRLGVYDNIIAYTDDTTYNYKYITIQSGLWDKGARIQLMRDDSLNDAGVLVLRGGITDLRVSPTNGVTVNGREVITTAGGYVDILRLGADAYAQGFAAQDTSGRPVYEAKYGFDTGAALLLRRGDATGFDQAGMAALKAQHVDGRMAYLMVFPDGMGYLNGSPIVTLTSAWSDGNGNFYRKYSDGWIEQGGIGWNPTFYQPFSNSNYVVVALSRRGWGYCVAVHAKHTTNVEFAQWQSANGGSFGDAVEWYACGY